MTDATLSRNAKMTARLKRRHQAEKRFRLYGLISIVGALVFLVVLLGSIVGKGYSAFMQTEIALSIYFDPAKIDPEGKRDESVLAAADYAALSRQALMETLALSNPDRQTRRKLGGLLSQGADYILRDRVMNDPSLIGTSQTIWLPTSANVDQLFKGHISRDQELGGRFDEEQLGWIDSLSEKGAFRSSFNTWLFSSGDSRQPELAGIRGALVGSLLVLAVTFALSFPMGVGAAIYLEEFAPKNRWTDMIEVNINNLAAVPSIIFGLLALEMFLNVFGMPRSAPLVGGLTLSLLCLPTIIIAGRVALRAVPSSIRAASLGLGASKLQTISNHVLPLAMPGIMTGSIIAMARALGETAPLLMIGMVAFIVDVPKTVTDPSTVLPVQIYLWSASPERAFVERTSAAIMILLAFLIVMNLTAVVLRKKFEKRW